jgi:hypothetical protein
VGHCHWKRHSNDPAIQFESVDLFSKHLVLLGTSHWRVIVVRKGLAFLMLSDEVRNI